MLDPEEGERLRAGKQGSTQWTSVILSPRVGSVLASNPLPFMAQVQGFREGALGQEFRSLASSPDCAPDSACPGGLRGHSHKLKCPHCLLHSSLAPLLFRNFQIGLLTRQLSCKSFLVPGALSDPEDVEMGFCPVTQAALELLSSKQSFRLSLPNCWDHRLETGSCSTPRLECRVVISAHYSLSLLGSSSPSTSASQVAGSQIGFCGVAQAGLELLASSCPPASISQSAGIAGMSHHAQPSTLSILTHLSITTVL
ncbi:hypothetical protein AAY473_027193 [Plecturocebus cupreus]